MYFKNQKLCENTVLMSSFVSKHHFPFNKCHYISRGDKFYYINKKSCENTLLMYSFFFVSKHHFSFNKCQNTSGQ